VTYEVVNSIVKGYVYDDVAMWTMITGLENVADIAVAI
jgi:hypothetical protein